MKKIVRAFFVKLIGLHAGIVISTGWNLWDHEVEKVVRTTLVYVLCFLVFWQGWDAKGDKKTYPEYPLEDIPK